MAGAAAQPCHPLFVSLDQRSTGGPRGGVKDRPCAIVLAVSAAQDRTGSSSCPSPTRRHSRLTRGSSCAPRPRPASGWTTNERSWPIMSEGNDFIWPGPDLRPVAGQGSESIAYVDGGASRRDHRRRCRLTHPMGGVLRRGGAAGPDRHAGPSADGAQRARDVAPGAAGGGAGQASAGGHRAIPEAGVPDRAGPAGTAPAAAAVSSSDATGGERRTDAGGESHPGAPRLPVPGGGAGGDRPGVRSARRP